jgi:membrane protein involved in colicin uptake
MESLRAEVRGIWEDIGRDISPLLPQGQSVVGMVRAGRQAWVDSQASFYRTIGLGGLMGGDGTAQDVETAMRAQEEMDRRRKSMAELDRFRQQDRIRPDDPVLAARQDMDDALKERQRELDKMQGLGADEKARNLQGLREKHEAAIAEILKRQAEQKDAMREADQQAADDAQQRRAQEMADAQRDASERAQQQAREREAMKEQFELEARRPAMTAREADELERLIAFRARLRTIAEMDAIDSTKAELAGAAQAAFMAGNARASMASERGGTVGAGLSGGSNLAQALGASVNWAQTQAKATIEGTELLRKLTGEVADLKRELGLGIGALRV